MRFFSFSLCLASIVHVAAAADNPTFMMVSGITAAEEMCLTTGGAAAQGSDLILEPCASAVAAGDGRELWQRLPNGQLAQVTGQACIGADGDSILLASCDSASAWEAQGNGQLKLAQSGDRCLSQAGPAAGTEDVAARGAITASSSADVAAHGANMAVDGSSSTFWASAMDPAGPVELTVDVGSQRKLASVEIAWEFPAKAFAVSISTDGVKWSEVHATDSNVLSSSRILLGSAHASKIKVVMHQAAGHFHGHAVYGIRRISVLAPRLTSVLEDCAAAAKSDDARDKYFATYVGEFASCSSKTLRSELPSLEAARASVAAATAELADLLPKLGSCRGANALATGLKSPMGTRFTAAGLTREGQRGSSGGSSALARKVDEQNGLDAAGVAALLSEARRVIVAARGALF